MNYNNEIFEQCPQCKKGVNKSTNRLVQDTCGHKKCRFCLMQDDEGCKMCNENTENAILTNINNLNVSVIKYDDSHKSEIFDLLSSVKSSEVNTTRKCIEESNHLIDTNTCHNLSNKSQKKKSKRQYRSFIIPSHVSVISTSPPMYKCTVCLKSFHSSTNVKYHLYCAGLEKPLKCDECGKGFVSRSHLEAHTRSHKGTRPFNCLVCPKSFIQKSKLNRHMKLHTGDLQYICSECGKKFSNKDGLNSHLRTHSGDKPFTCSECNSRFSNKSNLTKHLVTHSKDKLFMCEQCGKKFAGKWALVVHKKIHTSNRAYSCDQCSRAFTNRKDLKRHQVIHLDTKMYNCHICTTKFRRKDNLDRHIKNTHSSNDHHAQKNKNLTAKLPGESKPTDELYNSNNVRFIEPVAIKPLATPDTSLDNNFLEKPNAINVIKSSNESITSNQNIRKPESSKNAVPVINGPFKLAFKTDTFKHNYNIHNRDYVETTPHIKMNKSYNMAESLNICQRILSPMNVSTLIDVIPECSNNLFNDKPKNVIMSVGKVNEKDSLEICKKILSPMDAPSLHYETSFENKANASMINIKFKLPSTYTNNVNKAIINNAEMQEEFNYSDEMSEINKLKQVSNANYDLECASHEYTELQPVNTEINNKESFIITPENYSEHQSVIVNPHMSDAIPHSDRHNVPPFNEMHWRKRTSQIPQSK